MREGDGTTGAAPDAETLAALVALPTADDWPDISDQERERRERILWEVALRLLEDGPRRTVPSPERGRQFIPFAALRGYDEMLAEVEREAGGADAGA